MATVDAKRMYSWWWDSHISPKNSKWLQENLTDMDSKVKQMIKVIEEDADSFARRAEMYYKKRPELMNIVEEFYRAYRALAERYDHATGVIHQAHRTMAEAFPNQVPFILSDESPSDFSAEADPHTPEVPHPMHAFFDPDEIQKDVPGFSSNFHSVKRSEALTVEPDFAMSRMDLKQLNDLFGNGEGISHGNSAEGKARKGLNFHDMEEGDRSSQKSGDFSESDEVSKAETEILNLKKSLAKLEAEKEAGILQYQQSLDRLSNLESEVSRAQEDSQGLNVQASKAEVEVQNLKETLTKLEAKRESSIFQYQQCLEKISYLESRISSAQKDVGELNERATKAETETNALKQDLARIEAEKEVALLQYNKCLEMISNLEEKLVRAEEEANRINERARKAECDVEILKEEVSRLNEEKEAAALRYQVCLETISQLEQKLFSAKEEAKRLNSMIEDEFAKLKGAEERCVLLEKSNQTLQSELESFKLRVGSQGVELVEKQKELGRLWTCIQEERMRFLEAETAFQTLQHLHSQSQEELRSVVAELQNRAKILNDMETQSRVLEDEIQKVKEKNKSLNELNLSSAVSITNLQDEILILKETIKELEEEVDLRVDQRNALQQEIYCLKEELNDLNKEHRTMVEQVDSVGFDPKCFGSSIKELQNENSELKQICEANKSEKEASLEKLVVMEILMEKNYLLENSLADLNVELEDVRKKVQSLEESCQSLLDEKLIIVAENTNLVSQLQTTTEKLDTLVEKRNFLESSLSEANNELEGLRVKSRNLENSCLLLNSEKIGLITERESLVSQYNITQKKLEAIGNSYTELEHKLSDLEKERESALHIAEELRVSLDAEKQERASFAQLSETRLASIEFQICHLQEEVQRRKKDYEEEQDKSLNAHLEILILLKFIEDLEGKSFSFLMEHQKLLDASKLSEKLISELDHKINDLQVDIKSLSEENEVLRMWLYQVLKTLDIGENHECPSKMEEDQELLKHILIKLKEAQDALVRSCNAIDQLVIEKSVLVTVIRQLELEGVSVMEERERIGWELRTQYEQFLALQGEAQILGQMNEEFRLKAVEEGDRKEKALTSKLDDLQKQLLEFQGAYRNLQEENHKALEDKISLNKKVMELEEERCYLKEECFAMFGEKLFQSNLSLVFNDIISKNSRELEEINEDYNRIHLVNLDLMGKLRMFEEKFDDIQKKNLYLKDSMSKLDNELITKKSLNQQLNGEMTGAKDMLSQKNKKIQLLESQVVTALGEQLISTVCKVVIEGKILELAESYKSLQNKSNFTDAEIELLKEKVFTLEDANGGLQKQLAAYLPAVISLNDSITSVEKLTLKHSRSHKFDMEDAHQVALQAEISQRGEDHFATVADGISDLQAMQSRIRDIQNAVMEKERLMVLENVNANDNLNGLMEIEEFKDGNSSYKENGRTNKLVPSNDEAELGSGLNENLKLKRHTYEISNSGDGVLTKDILLDQVSDCSSYGISKGETAGGDDQMLELWDITDHDGSMDLMVGNTQKVVAAPLDYFYVEAIKEHKGSRYPSTKSVVVKDMDVDKSELSKKVAESGLEGNDKKILERLDSDLQKLTNLQITVQDLKRKVEVSEKSEKANDIELNTVKAQLEEVEKSIAKLFEGNCKLMKNIEEGVSISNEGMSTIVSEESGSISRRRTSELARRGSEQIGRLQLEVQKLQFLLLKLDKKGSRGTRRIADWKTRVRLKDYLYSVGVRTGEKPKKPLFCGCMKPPAKGD